MASSVDHKDHLEAAHLAGEAGRLLVRLRTGIGETMTADEARNRGDAESHEFLAQEISRLHPEDGLLSEEGKDDLRRLARDRVWIIDPLDGTREFGEPPRDDWAVHVALAHRGRAIVGAVALPGLGVVLSTANPPHANRSNGAVRLVVSRTRPPTSVEELASVLGAELVSMGSAGAKAMAIVLGNADIYFHSGGQYEWDSAAPVAVAKCAGLHVSRGDGSEITYNHEDPWLPDVLICRPELAEQALSAIGKVGSL